MAEAKTNACRILDAKQIPYTLHTYDHGDGLIDGLSVAEKTGLDPTHVFKTLVTRATGKQEFYVFVIPVGEELHLKKAAKAVGAKAIEMIHVSEINKLTGYVRGGCSPVGMKKRFPTVFHQSAKSLNWIAVSGGRIGLQLQCNPIDLAALVDGSFEDLIQ